MKKIIWSNEFITIERNGTRHTYALRQVSFESMRRLWSIRDRCTMVEQDFYKSVYQF